MSPVKHLARYRPGRLRSDGGCGRAGVNVASYSLGIKDALRRYQELKSETGECVLAGMCATIEGGPLG